MGCSLSFSPTKSLKSNLFDIHGTLYSGGHHFGEFSVAQHRSEGSVERAEVAISLWGAHDWFQINLNWI